MRITRPVPVILAMLALAAVLQLQGVSSRSEDPARALPAAAPAGGTSFMVAGDSITADTSPNVSGGELGERSWVRFAQDPGSGTRWVGGWALGGATTADMARHLAPVDAQVLVILGGTNDLSHGVPRTEVAANLQAIAAIADTPRVLVSSIPPRDGTGAATAAYNDWLAGFAVAQGWEFIDASAGLRDPHDPLSFAPEHTYDDIHPSLSGARVLGEAIGAAIGAALAGHVGAAGN